MSKVQKTDTCWLWIAPCGKRRYGATSYRGKSVEAHRMVYTMFRGDIPMGLTLDHLCRNRKCVNPEHLEPVTIQENIRRAVKFIQRSNYCRNGHKLTAGNTFVLIRGSHQYRRCKACDTLQRKEAEVRGKKRFTKSCDKCGKSYGTRYSTQRFCSRDCAFKRY